MNKKEKQDFPMVKQFTIQSLHYNICSPFPHLQKKMKKCEINTQQYWITCKSSTRCQKCIICSLKNFAQGTNQARLFEPWKVPFT